MQQRILLVDDREDNLLAMETILANDGYQFVKATSGRQALKILLNEYDFALILMDVKMPAPDGFETASLIYERERLRHIPIIFITAHSYGDENIFKGYQAGAVDYIYKPINPDLLRAKVSVFIELYKKNQRLQAQEQRLIMINRSLENEIKERKNSEEQVKGLNLQLLQNIDKLEAANKDLDRFAFMASHDLQEPLRKILLFGDRLLTKYGDVLDADGKKCVDRIQYGAERMQLLIENIFTFSKITNRKKEFTNSDLNQLLREVIGEMDSLIHEKNANLSVEPLPSLPVNPVLMRPLFHNLLSNALKYSRKDIQPEIRIYPEAGDSQSQNKYSRIFFEDNGVGFDQEYSEKIFSMFTRLSPADGVDGTGIGLALCKKIVEEHNGFITAKSKIGQGSTFIVSLPWAQEQMKKIEEPKAANI